MKNEKTQNHSLWHNDPIQFARLLTELVANNETLNIQSVADSMDLSIAEVDSIFDRAVSAFEYANQSGGFKVGNLHVETESGSNLTDFVSAERKPSFKSNSLNPSSKVFINDFCFGTEEKSNVDDSEVIHYQTIGFSLQSQNKACSLLEATLKADTSEIPSGFVLLETLQSAVFVGYSQSQSGLSAEFSVNGTAFKLLKREGSVEIKFSVLLDSDFAMNYSIPLKQVLLLAIEDASRTLDTDMESSLCLDFFSGLSVD